MNPLHYPSLEICKKLTEDWFGNTEKLYITPFPHNRPSWEIKWIIIDSDKSLYYEWEVDIYVAASNSSITDAAKSKNLWDDKYFFYQISNPIWNQIKIIDWDERKIHFIISDTLPNALAEMWLYLKQNNYI